MTASPDITSAPATTGPLTSRVAAFLDLIKFTHTIFALPFALLGTFMAAHATSAVTGHHWPSLLGLALILVCMAAGRTFAMTVNRLVDRRFDAANPRTARRPSVTGAISVRFMVIAITVTALVFAAAASGFYFAFANPWPLILSAPLLAWLGLYSFTKRFTSLCHFWLGISLGMAPVSAWIALAPPIGPVLAPAPLLLGLAVVLWVAGFDILYALQDEMLDRSQGLHSMPALLGRSGAMILSRLCHLLAVIALICVGVAFGFGTLYWVATTAAAILLVVEQSLVRPSDISRINIAFMTINGLVGVTFGALGILDLLLR